MKRVFADAGYWIALLNPRDGGHTKAVQVSESLSQTRMVTSEMVLAEVLNAFASKGSGLRLTACAAVDAIRSDPNAEVIPMTSESFRRAMDRYRSRSDKRGA